MVFLTERHSGHFLLHRTTSGLPHSPGYARQDQLSKVGKDLETCISHCLPVSELADKTPVRESRRAEVKQNFGGLWPFLPPFRSRRAEWACVSTWQCLQVISFCPRCPLTGRCSRTGTEPCQSFCVTRPNWTCIHFSTRWQSRRKYLREPASESFGSRVVMLCPYCPATLSSSLF